MNVRFELSGTSPLLCHNAQLADPDNKFVRQIAEITGKRKKTEEDRKEIARLEWFGGLYVQNGSGPVIPTGNVRKCLIEAGKVTKQGKQVSRAIAFADLHVPIAYEGPRDIEQLSKRDEFYNRTSVGIGARRTMRTRPCFPQWAVVADAILLEDVMDLSDLELVCERAGLAEGLGDNRVNGYGRFEGRVTAR